MPDPCKYEKEIGGLLEAMKHQRSEQEELKSDISQLVVEIKQINQKWGERPTWATLVIISILSGLVTYLSSLVGMGTSF